MEVLFLVGGGGGVLTIHKLTLYVKCRERQKVSQQVPMCSRNSLMFLAVPIPPSHWIHHLFQGGTNVHLSNVHFVLRDISALLDRSWGLVTAHFDSCSVEAIERRGGKRRHGREA